MRRQPRRLHGSARNVTCNLDSSRSSTNTWYGFGEVVRSFVNRPELGINRVQSHESSRPSMSESRTFRVLVVAPGANPAVVLDAVTAVAATDRRCVDELHVLTSADAADRLRAALLKPGVASALADRCRRLGIAYSRHRVQPPDDSRSRCFRKVRFNRRRRPRYPSAIVRGPDERGDCGRFVRCWRGRRPGAFRTSTRREARGRFFVLDVGPTARVGSEPRGQREGRVSRPILVGSPDHPRRTTHATQPVLYGVAHRQAPGATPALSARNTHVGRQAARHQNRRCRAALATSSIFLDVLSRDTCSKGAPAPPVVWQL